MTLTAQPLPSSRPPYSHSSASSTSTSHFAAPLLSYSYESLSPQPLSFHIHPKPPGVRIDCIPLHSVPRCLCGNQGFARLSSFALITSVQAQYFHELAHSFAQRRRANIPVLNSLRTLSIATGVVPPVSLYPYPIGLLAVSGSDRVLPKWVVTERGVESRDIIPPLNFIGRVHEVF